MADAPPWIYELAARPSGARQSEIGRQSLDMQAVLEGVPEGRRDQELFRAASKMRRMDLPYDMALEIIYIAASEVLAAVSAGASQSQGRVGLWPRPADRGARGCGRLSHAAERR